VLPLASSASPARPSAWALKVLVGALAACALSSALAQTTGLPGAGDVSRDLQRAEPSVPAPAARAQAVPDLPPAEPGAGLLEVKGFKFEQTTLVPEAQLQALVQPYIGQRLSLKQIEALIQRAVAMYREQGWLASVYLPPQEINDGVIRVAVIEARLESVEMQGPADANAEYIRSVVTSRLQIGEPVALPALERGLLLANDIPGMNATGVIEPGTKPGAVVLRISAEPSKDPKTTLEVRNYGGRSTGEEQAVVNFEYTPQRGYGERLLVSALASEGTRAISAGLSGAVGNDGLRVGVSASHLRYKLIGDFKPLDARGESNAMSLNASYPLLRSDQANLKLNAGLTYRGNRDYALGALLRNRRLTLSTLSVDGDRRDTWGGGGVNYGSVLFMRGLTKLRDSDADLAADQAGPQVQGYFTKVALTAGRWQVVTPQMSLSTTLAAQWANKNLDASERFVLGGPTNVRGYPVGEGSGDQGYLIKVELTRNLGAAWQGIAFFDSGGIRTNAKPWPGAASPNSYALHATGIGARWSGPDNWKFESALALPLGKNPAVADSSRNQDGSQHGLRLWVRLSKGF
jgi:hemolysin activation/secretion protein